MVKYVSSQWWRAAENGREPHQVLLPLIKQVRDSQQERYDAYKALSGIYGADMSSRGGALNPFRHVFDDTLSFNELKNTVDSLHAQVYKNRIVPSVVSIGGDHTRFSRAKQLTRWIDGVLDDCKLHQKVIPQAGLGCLVHGTGIVKVGYEIIDESRARITLDTVSALDIFVDIVEAKDGKPKSLFQITAVDKGSLIDDYGDPESDEAGLYGDSDQRTVAIMGSRNVQEVDEYMVNSGTMDADQTLVYEAWHLPTAKGKYGRYTMCVDGGTLIDREYEFKTFPHLFLRSGPPLHGFWGDSVAAQLVPGQKSYDKLTQRIDEAHDIMGVPRILLRKGMGLVKSHVDDIPGGILEYDGPDGGIKEWNATPITQDAYRERDGMPAKMRSVVGVSGMSATAQLPTQLRELSGVGLENWQDSEDARHAMEHRSYEDAICDLVYIINSIACALDDAGFSVQAKAVKGSSMEVIDFSDCKLDIEEFRLKVLPVSQMARTFSGRVKQLDPLLQQGAISMSTYRRLLEVPDIEMENDLDTADEDIIDQNLQFMLGGKGYTAPLAFDNLALIISRSTKFINKCRVQGVDEEDLAPIMQYISDAVDKKKTAEGADAPPPAQAGAPPPAPAGDPGMPPPGMGGQ